MQRGHQKALRGRERGHARELGQSLVEMCLATPLLVALLLGAIDTGILVSDEVVANTATRNGARLAADLGGSAANPGATTTDVDAKIVGNVLAAARGMHFATLMEIDIYQPTLANGSYQAGDLVDMFDGNGNALATQTYPINLRNQNPPYETNIGIRLVWQYQPPTGWLGGTMQFTEYTVFRAAPMVLL
jgi:Flp pilus assembly protein TadG